MNSRVKTDVKNLFEFWCEVKRAHSPINRNTRVGLNAPTGIIVESFPERFREEKTIAEIPAFAFPCEFESESVQSYSFVLTTDDSKWRFGFCRHDPKTDTAVVIITYLPWHDTFLRLLTVLAELRRSNDSDFRTFLAEAYNRGVPDPGGNLKLFYNGGLNYFMFERPLQFQLPSIPENHNLNLYYNFVDPKNMIAVFAAMLAERRIIFTSQRLDRLSSCIQAANAFLNPMVWQHIFIPVLPMKLKDYLSAPMPYLIGVPVMVLETMTPDELGEVAILNCDTKTFESPFDDVRELPTDIVSLMKKQLSHSSEHIGDRVSKIFLGVLVQLISGYRDAVEFRDSGKTFNRDKFIESRPKHLRPFLAKMMDLQIFQQFIDERLDMLNTGLGFSDEFELETARYAEKMKKRRHYEFLNNVKEKTNPAVKSAVKSVKEGSRGVKTAYKDLKSKFRDITPPNSNSGGSSSSSTHFRSHLASNSQHDRIDGISSASNCYVINKPSASGVHHSAPSSPIFNKRTGSGSTTTDGGGISSLTDIKAGPAHTNGVRRGAGQQQHLPPPPLSMSASSAHIRSNGHANATHGTTHLNSHLAASPTVSPASSLCSSEMNLSQELQNHPLFMPPLVDRSSLRSLQPHHMHISSAPNSIISTRPQQEHAMNDLITLDDSNNTSFDLEDFDPLNQNARPLPLGGGGSNRNSYIKSKTLPTGSFINNSSIGANQQSSSLANNSIGNPLYPYFKSHHKRIVQLQPPATKPPPPPLPTSVPPPMPPPDEDFELLRKYGLDQFTLTTTATTTVHTNALVAGNNSHTNTMTTTTGGMSNWTTFD